MIRVVWRPLEVVIVGRIGKVQGEDGRRVARNIDKSRSAE